MGHMMGSGLLTKRGHGMQDGEEIIPRFGLNQVNIPKKFQVNQKRHESNADRAVRLTKAMSSIVANSKDLLGLFFER
jgi:hypothetical protein